MPPPVILIGGGIPDLTRSFLPYRPLDWSPYAHTR
jgi:hypothetical protein